MKLGVQTLIPPKTKKNPNKPTKKIVKTQVTEWKKIFSNHVTNKKLVFRI
jgi:hypothetical protein